MVDFGNGYQERIDPRLLEPGQLSGSLELAGIDAAVISVNQPGVLTLAAPDATAIARDANDELIDLLAGMGGGSQGLATLPWQSTDAAIEELHRTAALGLRGAMVCSNIGDRPLDDQAFDPTFAAASSLGLPLLLHPTVPTQVAALTDHQLISAVGFLFDTTTAILRMIFEGTFERHPTLKIILAHAGSLLPMLIGRVDRQYLRGAIPNVLPHGKRPSDYLSRLYTDTIAGSPTALELAVKVFGADRVCFGSDYPFTSQQQALALVSSAALRDKEASAILGGNAVELFGLQLTGGSSLKEGNRL